MNYLELEERRRQARVDFGFWLILTIVVLAGAGVRACCVKERAAEVQRGVGK